MRHVRRIALGLLGFLIVLVLAVHIYAEVYRIRVEHLLATLKSFQVEETPAAAVLKLRHEYRFEAANRSACSEEHCDFWIGLTEWGFLLKPSDQGRLSKNLARCVPERCLFADGAAQNSSITEEATARLRKQGRVRHRPNQCHYSGTESRNQIGAIVTLFCRIRCEHDRWKGPCRSILF